MAKIRSKERVARYSAEFKFRVVKLTEQLDVDTAQIASAMGLHPVMVYRWRQEYREGLLVDIPTRRISMTNPKKSNPKRDQKEIKQLKKQLAALQKENDFLEIMGTDLFLKNKSVPFYLCFIFEASTYMSEDVRIELIFHFLSLNQDIEDFKRVDYELTTNSWSGSRVPYIEKEKCFLMKIIPRLNSIDLLDHKSYVEQQIESKDRAIEYEKKRDFLSEF